MKACLLLIINYQLSASVMEMIAQKSAWSLGGGSGARVVCSSSEGHWIATGLALAMYKGELMENADRLLRLSGSPRAFSPRDNQGLN